MVNYLLLVFPVSFSIGESFLQGRLVCVKIFKPNF